MRNLFVDALLLTSLICYTAATTSPTSSFRIQGQVRDNNGRGIQNVVVNDGVHFTTTDINGDWQLVSDTAESKFIAISTPAEYELPQANGLATGFYIPIKQAVNTVENTFILKKRSSQSDKFSYIAISDPQVSNSNNMTRWRNEAIVDIKNVVDSLNDSREVVGVALGDLVWDKMKLFEPYKKSMKNMGMTVFQCIGNHDFDKQFKDLNNMPKGSSNFAEHEYFKYFGPTNYSFNIGKIHVITVKNINYKGSIGYTEELTKPVLDWIKHDLSYVPAGTTVFLNMHAAGWNTAAEEGNIRDAKQLEEILKDYTVHVFCGHTHFFQNAEPNAKLYQHNIGAVCGAWWDSWINRCGAPNGYLIVNVDGNDVSWSYKATREKSNYQFKTYLPGTFITQKDYFVANVWDYDSQCKVEWMADGKPMGEMERFTDQDQSYLENTDKHNDNGPINTPHLFRVKAPVGTRVVTVAFTNRFGERFVQQVSLNHGWHSRIIAHRGYWNTVGSAQNSIAALRKANQIKAYGSEFDVQMTKDHKIVVNHDDDINGIKIITANYSDVKYQRLPNGEKLPTLQEYLENGRACKYTKLILEIKPHPTEELENQCVDKVVSLVRALGMSHRVEYISFSKNICRQLADKLYGASISYLEGDLTPKEAKDLGMRGIDYDVAVLRKHPEWVKQAHDLGMTVNVWTVNKLDDIRYFLSLGVDYVTTNEPVAAMKLEKQMGL